MALAALVTLVPRPGAAVELVERVRDVIADVQAEPGNLLALVMRDPAEPDRLVLLEIYRDQAAIMAHGQAPHAIEKGAQVRALLAEPPRSRWFETIDWPSPPSSLQKGAANA